jgi:hypothetical protein
VHLLQQAGVGVSEEKRAPRINLDLVEHLDDRAALFEVNVIRGEEPSVQVVLTDLDGTEHEGRLTPDTAWLIHRIITTYDRRAIRELGVLLGQGATLLNQEDDQ